MTDNIVCFVNEACNLNLTINDSLNTNCLTTSRSVYNSLMSSCADMNKNLLNWDISGIKSITDSYERKFEGCRLFFRNYYKINKSIPSLQQWEDYYNQHLAGEGNDIKRQEAIVNTYDFTLNGFKPELTSKSRYTYGDYLTSLDITQDQLNDLVKSKTSYQYRITLNDLDMALGAALILIQSNENKAIPTIGLENTINAIRQQAITKYPDLRLNKCNSHKRTALLILLQELGFVKRIDSDYIPGGKKARRYELTNKHPFNSKEITK